MAAGDLLCQWCGTYQGRTYVGGTWVCRGCEPRAEEEREAKLKAMADAEANAKNQKDS